MSDFKIVDDDEYYEWDFEDMHTIKCPYCTHEWDAYESHVNHGEPEREKEEKCQMCENTFLVESQICITFTTKRS